MSCWARGGVSVGGWWKQRDKVFLPHTCFDECEDGEMERSHNRCHLAKVVDTGREMDIAALCSASIDACSTVWND